MKKIFPNPGALIAGVSFLPRKTTATPVRFQHIVILGDSVAYGYGTRNGGITKYLKETFPDSRVTNLGINGLTSSGLVERMRSSLWQETISTADFILLNIGGNDLLRAFRSGGAKGLLRNFNALRRTYRQNLLEIYQWIRKWNRQAMIVQNSLYNSMKKEVQYFGFTNLLFKLWNKAIGEKDIIVARIDAMGKNQSIWLDPVHPNEEGYKLMHELLMNTLMTRGYSFHSQETKS